MGCSILFSLEFYFLIATFLGVGVYAFGFFGVQWFRLRDKWAKIVLAAIIRGPRVFALDMSRVLCGQALGWFVCYFSMQTSKKPCHVWWVLGQHTLFEFSSTALSILLAKPFTSQFTAKFCPFFTFLHFGKYNPDLSDSPPTTATTTITSTSTTTPSISSSTLVNNLSSHTSNTSHLCTIIDASEKLASPSLCHPPRISWWIAQTVFWSLCVLSSRIFMSSVILNPIPLCSTVTCASVKSDHFSPSPQNLTNPNATLLARHPSVLLLLILTTLHFIYQTFESVLVDRLQAYTNPVYTTSPVQMTMLENVRAFQMASSSSSSLSSLNQDVEDNDNNSNNNNNHSVVQEPTTKQQTHDNHTTNDKTANAIATTITTVITPSLTTATAITITQATTTPTSSSPSSTSSSLLSSLDTDEYKTHSSSVCDHTRPRAVCSDMSSSSSLSSSTAPAPANRKPAFVF